MSERPGSWQPYAARPGSTVTGTLLEWEGVGDANHAPRTLLAWLEREGISTVEQEFPEGHGDLRGRWHGVPGEHPGGAGEPPGRDDGQ